MTNALTFPSAIFPAFPTVSLEAADGWSATRAPGTVLSVVRGAKPGLFAPNVIITITRHDTGVDLAELMADVGREAVERNGSATEPEFTAELNDRTYRGRTIVIQEPAAGTLAQVHLATAIDHGGVSDVIHAVGTCAGDRVAADLPVIQDVLATITVTTPATE